MEDLSTYLSPAILVITVLVMVLLYIKIEERRIDRNIGHARKHKLNYLGEDLPPDIPSDLVDVLPATFRVRDCLSGTLHGESVFTFEFLRGWGFGGGWGRGKRWVSVVALEQVHRHEIQRTPGWGYRTARSGDWLIVYAGTSSAMRLPMTAIEGLWASMRSTAPGENVTMLRKRSTEGGMVIRPRHEVPKHEES